LPLRSVDRQFVEPRERGVHLARRALSGGDVQFERLVIEHEAARDERFVRKDENQPDWPLPVVDHFRNSVARLVTEKQYLSRICEIDRVGDSWNDAVFLEFIGEASRVEFAGGDRGVHVPSQSRNAARDDRHAPDEHAMCWQTRERSSDGS
jgi:hypothetical protein